MKKAGWSREDVQRYCFEHSRASVAELKRANLMPGAVTPDDERKTSTLVETPQDFLVLSAGGRAGVQSAFVPGWGSQDRLPERQPAHPPELRRRESRPERIA